MKRVAFAVALLAGMTASTPLAFAQQQPRVMIYEDDGFQGNSQTFTTPVADLRRWNMSDNVSSIIVVSGVWRFCDQTNFGGPCITLGPGRYPRLTPYNMNDKISSLAPNGYQNGNNGGWNGAPPAQTGGGWNNGPHNPGTGPVTLFEDDGFQGHWRSIGGPISNLENVGFNDKTSSIIIRSGRWLFCDFADYGNPCIRLGPGQYPRLSVYSMNDRISSVRPY